jgi:hypothetical protein
MKFLAVSEMTIRCIIDSTKNILELFLSAVMRWIEPSDFKDDLEQAQDLKTDGTTEWLFQESVFLSWRKSPTSATDSHQLNYLKSILWISGKDLLIDL